MIFRKYYRTRLRLVEFPIIGICLAGIPEKRDARENCEKRDPVLKWGVALHAYKKVFILKGETVQGFVRILVAGSSLRD